MLDEFDYGDTETNQHQGTNQLMLSTHNSQINEGDEEVGDAEITFQLSNRDRSAMSDRSNTGYQIRSSALRVSRNFSVKAPQDTSQ